MVTVTGVDVTSDLRRARVYISVMDGDAQASVAILDQVGHRLRGEIGRALRLRLAPELDFQIDETAAKASRIESLLAQIKAEDSTRER
jgi:ribosome-binding factor A